MENWVLPLIQKAKEESWTFLDLGNSGIKELPLELFELNSLKQLNLGTDYWSKQKNESVNSCHNGPKNSFLLIPNEIIQLQNMNTLSLSGCDQLSDEGLKSLQHLNSLKHLNLGNCFQLTDEGFKSLQHLKNLEQLNLECCEQLTNEGLKSLQHLKYLEQLNLAGCERFKSEGLKSLQHLNNLKQLDLSYCHQLTDEGVKSLQHLINLEQLKLEGCEQLTDEGLKYLQHLINLKQLDLSGYVQLTDEGLKYLQQLKNLKNLYLVGCKRLAGVGLKYLQHLKNLEQLKLECCEQLTDEGLRYLQHHINLKELYVGGCEQFTSEGLKHLKHLKNLKHLNLRYCQQLTDEGLKSLKHLNNLEQLNLEWCEQLTDEGLKSLQHLKNLEQLVLESCGLLTDEGVKYLQHLNNLKQLNLKVCGRLTDEGLKSLQHLSNLEQLDLGGGRQLTNVGLKYLQHLKYLKKLNLRRWQQLTDEGLKSLQHLKYLEQLDLELCQKLTDEGLKSLKHLNNLEQLSLENCRRLTDDGLKHLQNLKNLKWLNILDTSISIPREILHSKSPQQIFEWFNDKDKQPLQAFKLFLVGMGNVGKTHLCQRLMIEPDYINHFQARTREVVVKRHPWSTETESTYELILCDFGGQELMHQTHRFFLGAEHCFYLLVVRADWPPEKNRLDYWLRTIALHSNAGAKGKSPVLILITQTDRVELAKQKIEMLNVTGYDDSDPKTILDNFHQLREDLKRVSGSECNYYGANVIGTIDRLGYDSELFLDDQQFKEQIRKRNYDAVQKLKAKINEHLTEIPGISIGYPPNFFNFKKWVTEAFDSGVPYFNYKTNIAFQKLCEAEFIPENDGQKNSAGVMIDSRTLYLQILRNLGLIHFVGDLPYTQQSIFTEAKQWVFNPDWLNEPVYHRLLWGTEDLHQTGWLTFEQFNLLLSSPRSVGPPTPDQKKQYEEHERNAICQLLATMRVIHYKPDEDGFLIPDLLKSTDHPERVVSGLDNIDSPFIISYQYLPERIFFTFLARQYPHIPVEDRKDNCFRNVIRFWYEHPHDVNKKIEVAAVYEPYVEQSYQPRIVFYVGDTDPVVIRDCRRDLQKELKACYDKEHWNERDKLIQNVNSSNSDVHSEAPRVVSEDKRNSNQSNENEVRFHSLRYNTETGNVYLGGVLQLTLPPLEISGLLFQACLKELRNVKYDDSSSDGTISAEVNLSKLIRHGYDHSRCSKCHKNLTTLVTKGEQVCKCQEKYANDHALLDNMRSSRIRTLNKILHEKKVGFTIRKSSGKNLLIITLNLRTRLDV